MIDQTSPLNELPAYWREQVRKLRSENHELRTRLRSADIPSRIPLDEMPPSWVKKLTKIRAENAKYRAERNALREELAAVRAELEARSK